MKKKLLTLLAFVMAAMTAGAFTLTTGTSEHGTLAFKVQGVEVTEASEGDVVTVVCTPSTGYVANLPSGEWSAGVALARRAPSGVGILEPDFTLTPVDGVENQWTFTMQAANATVSMSYKKLLSNADISIADITAQTFTGQGLTPTLTVQDVSTVLTLNTDYTVTYSNNVNVGTATATVTAAANSENYAGTATKTFAITAKALEAGFIGTIEAVYYTGQPLTPEPVLTYNDLTLVKGTDYTLAYENNVNAGTATVKATAKQGGNFSGSAQKTFTINPNAVQAAWIEDIPEQVWDGTAKTPVLTVKDGEATLVLNKDYTVAYSNNTANSDKGAVATITGKGNYSGTASANFSIRKDFSSAQGKFQVRPIGTQTYNGTPLEPAVTVLENKTTLILNTDYTVSYSDNTDAGIGTATVTGIGKYSGTLVRSFTINAYDINSITSASLTDSITYTGSPIEPTGDDFTITFTRADNVVDTLKIDQDYYITEMKDNINVGTAKVTIEGMGNFINSREFSFVIKAKSVADSVVVIAPIDTMTYDGTAKKPDLTVTYGEVTLVKDTDYTVAYTDSIDAGNGKITITGIGNYTGTRDTTYVIRKADVTLTPPVPYDTLVYIGQAQNLVDSAHVTGPGVMTDVLIKYTLTPNDTTTWSTNISQGTNAGDYKVYYKVFGGANHNDVDTASVTVNIRKAIIERAVLVVADTLFTYDKTEKTARVDSVFAEGNISVPTDSYSVTGNKATNAGTYTAKVFAKENTNFSDTTTVSFRIQPAEASDRFTITLKDSTYVYDGTTKTPQVIVTDETDTLVVNTDYTFEFVEADTARIAIGTYTVKVTGMGNYINDTDTIFRITGKSVADPDVVIQPIDTVTYDGTAKKPDVTVKYGDLTLVKDTDYTVAYTDSIDAGNGKVTITGIGNFSNTRDTTYVISKADVTLTPPVPYDTLVYIGQAQNLVDSAHVTGPGVMTDVLIKYTLTPNDTTTWSTNISQGTNAGDYKVYYKVFGGANHNDVDTASVTVNIRKAVIERAVFLAADTLLTYDKSEQTARVDSVIAEGNIPVPTASYSVTGNKATNAGTYTAKVFAKENTNFSDTTTVSFRIQPAEASDRFTITLKDSVYVYDGTTKTPEVIVTDETDTLVVNTDYTFEFLEADTARIRVGTYRVKVTGIGNYIHDTDTIFRITKDSIKVIQAPLPNDTIVDLKSDSTTYVSHNLLKPGTVVGGKFQYSVDEGTTWADSIPQAINADTLTVYYKVIGDANHRDSVNADWKIETVISKAQATMAFNKAKYKLTYGDAPFTNAIRLWGKNEVHFVSSEPRVAQVHYFTGEVSINGAGTATISAKMLDHSNFNPADDTSYEVVIAARQVGNDDVVVGDSDAEGVPVITVSVQAPSGLLKPLVNNDYTLDYYTPEEDPYQRTLVTRQQMLAAPGEYYAVLTFFGNYAGCIEKLITVEDKRVVVGDIPGPDGTSDGVVDADDVEVFIDKLLEGDLPAPGDPGFESYDANGDGKVDVADAQAILNISLGLNWDGSLPGARRDEASGSQLEAVYNVSAATVADGITRYTVTIEGNFSYTGFQMDARGSVEFIGESGQAVGNMRGNTMKDGTRRVVGYGSVEAYANGTLLCLDVKGEGSVEVFNVVLTTSAAQSVRAVAGTATAITTVTTDNADVQAYDMSGRKVNTTDRKGVYIVNGKKVVRK